MIRFHDFEMKSKIYDSHGLTIYKAVENGSGTNLIFKIFHLNYYSLRSYQRFIQALDFFSNTKHPCIHNIENFSTYDEKGNYAFVLCLKELPKKEMNNLFDYVHNQKEKVGKQGIIKIIYSLASIIKIAHKHGIPVGRLDSYSIYFDNEFDNILFTPDGIEPHEFNENNKYDIYPWIAPETLQNDLTIEGDIYSLGVIILEMVDGKFPLNCSADKNDYMSSIIDGERDEISDSEFKDIIEKCLSLDPIKRPNIDEIFGFLEKYREKIKDYANKIDHSKQEINCGFEKNYQKYVDEDNPLFKLFKATLLPDSKKEEYLKLISDAANKKLPQAMFSLSFQIEEDNPKLSLELLRDAAKAGHVQSLSKLGMVAIQNKNFKEALELFKAAAESNDIFGIANCGKMYFIGVGIPQNIEISLKYLKKGVELGDSNCQFLLGSYLIENGKDDEGFKLLQLSGQQGNIRAQISIAFELSDKNSPKYNPSIALLMLKQLAEDGNVDSMLKAAQLLREGPEGIDINLKESYNLYTKAMMKGSQDGAIEVAECLIEGYGVEKDNEKGFKLLKFLSERGNINAMFRLSKLLKKYNDETYRQWLKNAAELDHPGAMFEWSKEINSNLFLIKSSQKKYPPAMNYLGELILSKKIDGTEEEAINLFTEASQKGNEQATLNLGILTLKTNKNKGIEYINKAASNGFPPAITQIGLMLLNGDIEGTVEEGAKLIEAAAQDNYPLAQYHIGMIYLQGIGVEKDINKANEYLRKAADNGESQAIQQLKSPEIIINKK